MKPYLKHKSSVDMSHKIKFLRKLGMENPSGLKALDLGCGSGHNTLSLSKHFDKVYGVDPSDDMLKFARTLKVSLKEDYANVRFYSGSFHKIPVRSDVIFMFNSLHFATNCSVLLKIMERLNNGGFIMISEPHNNSRFAKMLMDNPLLLKKKHDDLKRTRECLAQFIKTNVMQCLYNKVNNDETKYVVVFRKI